MSVLAREERDTAIVKALKAGSTKAEVAQTFGISERHVYGIGKKAGYVGVGGGKRVKGEGPSLFEQRINAWDDAQRAYLRSLIADLPDPVQYARYLPSYAAAALMTARYDKQAPGWYVLPDPAKILRPMGLCEAGKGHSGYYLGSFGLKVFREIQKDWK